MKYLDEIEVITDNYEKFGIPKGAKGTIIMPEIRNQCFECELDCSVEIFPIKIKDLKVISESQIEDSIILNDLPTNEPKWWCKVEDGYIINLLGERKNKEQYNYDS